MKASSITALVCALIAGVVLQTPAYAASSAARKGTGPLDYRALTPPVRTPPVRTPPLRMLPLRTPPLHTLSLHASPLRTPPLRTPLPRGVAAGATLAATPRNGVIGGPRVISHGVIGGPANMKPQLKASIDGSALRRRF
jgi:hypothetical protein